MLKRLWHLVFKEVGGILHFPNSIPPSHYKLLNCNWLIISTPLREGVPFDCFKFKTHLFRKVVNIDAVVQVGVLEDRSHVAATQVFKFQSVEISKP